LLYQVSFICCIQNCINFGQKVYLV
jgi:hypothetical protein